MKWVLDEKDMEKLAAEKEAIGFKKAEKRLQDILLGARNFYMSTSDVSYGFIGWTPPREVSLADPWKDLIKILDKKVGDSSK